METAKRCRVFDGASTSVDRCVCVVVLVLAAASVW
jgi:hypothetical protein